MKNKMLILMICILFISVNLYADGDLTVMGGLDVGSGGLIYDSPTGRVGIGHTAPKGLFDVRFDRNNLGSITAGGGIDSANLHAITGGVLANSSFVRGGFFMAERQNSGTAATSIEGLNNTAAYTGTGDLTNSSALVAGKYTILFKSTGGGSATIQGTKGIRVVHNIHESHNQTTTLNNAANFTSDGVNSYGPLITIDNFKHFEVVEGNAAISKQYGFFMNKLTQGTYNAGIVLNGDGNGADLVLGANKDVAIYGNNGNLVIDTSGNVGIGTSTPNYPLEVANANGAHVTVGGVWTNSSSREYKENINSLSGDEAMKALKELKPVKFNYKADKEEEYIGFIAEDVPGLVATRDRKSLSPMDIVAVLTSVVKEQQNAIAELNEKIDRLAQEVKFKESLALLDSDLY